MNEPTSLVEARVQRLEARIRFLLGLNLLALTLIGVLVLSGFNIPRHGHALVADSLSVGDLRVVDSNGIVRARVSANMPDAVIRGRRVPRGEHAAGVMLYDDLGQERGGYVTFTPSRSVALTLDTRQGQVATFAADSSGGAALGMFELNSRLEVRASQSTGTGLFVWKNGALRLQEPPLTGVEEAKVCSEMKDEVAAARAQANQQIDDARVLAACRLHMSDGGCRKCFGK